MLWGLLHSYGWVTITIGEQEGLRAVRLYCGAGLRGMQADRCLGDNFGCGAARDTIVVICEWNPLCVRSLPGLAATTQAGAQVRPPGWSRVLARPSIRFAESTLGLDAFPLLSSAA